MPLLVHCHDLSPGMRLAEAFLWRGRSMLPGGKVLSSDDIDILQRKYPEVTVKIGDPVLDSVAEFEDDTRDREIAQSATQQISKSMAEVQDRFNSRTDASKLNFNAMRAAAESVIRYLEGNPVSAALLNRGNGEGNPITERTGNVFYLALILGTSVRDYVMRERVRQTSASNLSLQVAMDLLPLGLGAMFMDVGMLPMAKLYNSSEPLTEEDREKVRQHPIAGADMLPDSLPAGVKNIVRSHHENFDGSGYPSGLQGGQLHIFTRIVRICDAYEAATSTRAYAKSKSPARVIWEITAGPYRHCYDPVLAKVFANLIQPFPIGAKLKLQDGRTGVVVRYNRKNPFAPSIIVAFDENNQRIPLDAIEPPVIAGQSRHMRIKSFGNEELDYIYQDEPPAIEAPVADFRQLADACYP